MEFARDFILFAAVVAILGVAWVGVRRMRAEDQDKATVLRRVVGTDVSIDVPTGGRLQWNKTVKGVVVDVTAHGVVVRQPSGKDRSIPLTAVRSVRAGRRRLGRWS